jgi:GNAT superfamily N-acetyltransferase
MRESLNFSIVSSDVYYMRLEIIPDFGFINEFVYLEELKKPIHTDIYLKSYKRVGLHLNWLDRLVLSLYELHNKINSAKTHVYHILYNNSEIGYAELIEEPNYIELLYFGLYPEFVGKGLGKQSLLLVIQKALSFQKQWVQLNTCDLDHGNALKVYENCGFRVYKVQKEDRKVLI